MNHRLRALLRDHATALLALLLIALFVTPRAYACEVAKAVALVRLAEGAWVEDKDGRRALQGGERVCIGSQLIVPGPGRIQVELIRSSIGSPQPSPPIINLGSHSSLRFRPPIKQTNWLLQLVDGWFRFFSPRPTSIDVEAGYLTAGVRGTEFVVQKQQDGCSHLKDPDSVPGCTALWVQEGTVGACPSSLGCDFGGSDTQSSQLVEVHASGKDGRLRGAELRTLLALPGEPLRLGRLAIHPDDAVNWVLYYPPLVRLQRPDCGFDVAKGNSDAEVLACGRPAQIVESLQALDVAIDTDLVTLGVMRLVQAGAGDQALVLLKRLAETHKQASLYALYSVVALKQNDINGAESASSQALALDPNSADALMARSFVLQARFDLEGAKSVAERAADKAPKEPLIAARMAELLLSLDEPSKALEQAHIAVRLAGEPDPIGCHHKQDGRPGPDPVVSRAWSVLGFTYLVRSDIGTAQRCLQTAIATDPLAPLPQLGLGLAKIRAGLLDEGVGHLERAVALDPRVSLYRSYLAKGYFEQDKFDLAEKELNLAKAYDPADPTPWLYSAFLLQVRNKPIDAFDALKESRSRNDNRAVYRSRLLLDEDLATREANLGRVYRELGFEKLALLEGSKSIDTDPGNYAGHRLLADGYANQPRHEVARVSELLQAQLRQPVNIGPLQPQLTDSDLFYRRGAGPGSVTYNEYTTLFNHNGTTIQASALGGTQQTLSDELVLFGVHDRASYSVSQYHYSSDGIRENNDLEVDSLGAFVQYRLTPDTSIQAEFRTRDQESGDLQQLFDPNNFNEFIREKEKTESVRFGFLHKFSAQSNIVANLAISYTDTVHVIPDPLIPFVPTISSEQDSAHAELQHLRKLESGHLISGVAYYSDSVEKTATMFGSTESNVHHGTAYAYAPISYSDTFRLTLGLSYDDYDGVLTDRNQFNPKLGAVWTPTGRTTVRGAAFRSLKRDLIANQTLEPTNLAGFNQFYDDDTGADVLQFGVGLDQSINSSLDLGIEVSRRNLKFPTEVFDVFTFMVSTIEAEYTEDVLQAYLYWRARNNLTFSADYRIELFEYEDEIIGDEQYVELDTHYLKLGLDYFLPSGWSFNLGATYVDQSGIFSDPFTTGALIPRGDNFMVFDFGASYEFNKGKGVIALEMRNLFDTEFRYQDLDPSNSRLVPELAVFGSIKLFF